MQQYASVKKQTDTTSPNRSNVDRRYIPIIFTQTADNMILHLHRTVKLAASLIVVCGSVITSAVANDNVDVHWTKEDTNTDNVQYQAAAAGLRNGAIDESAIVVAVS